MSVTDIFRYLHKPKTAAREAIECKRYFPTTVKNELISQYLASVSQDGTELDILFLFLFLFLSTANHRRS